MGKKPAWEARFKCQTLLDDTAVLSAMAYVDLNPIRAKLCDVLEASEHTSAHMRINEIDKNHGKADQPLAPLLGLRGFGVLTMSQADYLELVDNTGRQLHPGKRGAITGPPPAALARIGYTPERWRGQVLAVGSDYYRAIGAAEALVDKAAEVGQKWLRGIAIARYLKTVRI